MKQSLKKGKYNYAASKHPFASLFISFYLFNFDSTFPGVLSKHHLLPLLCNCERHRIPTVCLWALTSHYYSGEKVKSPFLKPRERRQLQQAASHGTWSISPWGDGDKNGSANLSLVSPTSLWLQAMEMQSLFKNMTQEAAIYWVKPFTHLAQS